jgi:hypothetical protein
MEITNFQQTGFDIIMSKLKNNCLLQLSLQEKKEIMKLCNISFKYISSH